MALEEPVFAQMKAWLFALENPANPFQDRRRIVSGENPVGDCIVPTQVKSFVSDISALAAVNDEHDLFEGLPEDLDVVKAGDAVEGMNRCMGQVDPELELGAHAACAAIVLAETPRRWGAAGVDQRNENPCHMPDARGS